MNSIERFYATVERKPVDRPACWLGDPTPAEAKRLCEFYKVPDVKALKRVCAGLQVVGQGDGWCFGQQVHVRNPEAIDTALALGGAKALGAAALDGQQAGLGRNQGFDMAQRAHGGQGFGGGAGLAHLGAAGQRHHPERGTQRMAFAHHVEVAHLEHPQRQAPTGVEHGTQREKGEGNEGSGCVSHGVSRCGDYHPTAGAGGVVPPASLSLFIGLSGPPFPMLLEIITFVLDVVVGFVAGACLLRLYMQHQRVPFGNPVGRMVFALTDWLVLPLRRVVPAAGRWDLASLVAALLLELAQYALLWLLLGASATVLAVPLLAGFGLARLVLSGLIGLVLVFAVLSWVQPGSPVLHVLGRLCEPLLRPLRRFIPLVGGVDLSPLVVMILLQVGLIVLGNLQRSALAAL